MVTNAYRALGSVAVLALLAGCTAHGTSAVTPTVTRTLTRPASTPAPAPTAALKTGPTTAAAAAACPRIAQQSVSDAVGMRLARITVLRAGGKVTGCRFYALQGSTLATTERLPGPNQPVVEFTATAYPSALAAHNALVRTAEAGTAAEQATLAGGSTGVAFQTAFDPIDKAKDWACGFTVGSSLVLVRTAVTDSYEAVTLAKALQPTY